MKKIKTYKGQKLYKFAKKIISNGNMLLSKKPEMFLPNKWPAYFKKTNGCLVWDLDGNKYYDMSLMGVGTNVLGYNDKDVDLAVTKAVKSGNMSTLNCPEEVILAKKMISIHPWAGKVKFARTGGEANSIAIRIARASTNKTNVAICGYHGWHDWYLATNLQSNKNLNKHLISGLKIKGVPKNLKDTVFPFNYNDFNYLKKIIEEKKIGIICMEVIRNFKPEQNFLKKVRSLANRKNIILIFDECTTGFRQNFGGIHKTYNVNPDLAVFGKALGNGYAITAVIGKDKYMKNTDETFISSTFWTEKIGYAAAISTLNKMKKIKSWKIIKSNGEYILKKFKKLDKKFDFNLNIQGIPSLCSFTIDSKNWPKYKLFIIQEMLKEGFLATNSIYTCVKHNKKIIDKYFKVLEKLFYMIDLFEKKIKDVNKSINFSNYPKKFGRLN